MPALDVMESTPASAVKAENTKSVQVLDELMQKLSVSKSADESTQAAGNLATFINGPIEEHDAPTKTVEALRKSLANKKDANARERALDAIKAIASHASVSPAVEPYLVALLGAVLASVGDKMTPVRVAAQSAALAIVQAVSGHAVKAVLPPLLQSVSSAQKWQEKSTALECIDSLVASAPTEMAIRVPDLIPTVSEAMWDTKAEIKKTAYATMEKVCALISNKDIERFIPELIKCIAHPENVSETVHLLGATTFVTDVHEPTLAIMVPLLDRGLAERETAIKRKSAVIVDNMCKLVEDPNIVSSFLPKLMPALNKNFDNLADPEARGKTRQALDTLTRVGNVKDGKIPERSTAGELSTVRPILLEILNKDVAEKLSVVVEYVAGIAGQLIDEKNNDNADWVLYLAPFLGVICGEAEAKPTAEALRKRASPAAIEESEAEDDEEEGEDLCNCTFNLAYGAKILLNQTTLRLKKGRRYGLLGANGTGKSTLLRAIENDQVEGFPKKNELRRLDAADTELNVIQWTMKKLEETGLKLTQDQVESQLKDFGFQDHQFTAAITSLSGGWRMKLALARGMLEEPDLILLDEPTNHLDVVNVKWLQDFLINSKATSLIVSHDRGFLDAVLQDVYHYERFKLKRYRGNLTAFIKKNPAAKAYADIGESEQTMKFPSPGYLEGVKTKGKAIVRVKDLAFRYPGTDKDQISGVTFQVSLSSRIACIGPNGAGKSTLINCLAGELIPTGGEAYVHENCRMAYLKQHAFEQIDRHQNSTPSEYIQFRFASGEDRETLDRANKQITEADESAMNHVYSYEGSKRRVTGIIARRKLKNSYEYQCETSLGENIGTKTEKWTPLMSADNIWLPRSELLETHSKMVAEVDQKEALAAGTFRPLVRKEIEEHCQMFGLEPEIVSHSRIAGLSGGQRIKVCLAASTWLRPHIIILDEPSNFLDRDSLGALSKALREFEGGVVISEFTQAITSEVWSVNHGKMVPSGHQWTDSKANRGEKIAEEGENDEVVRDALGNVVESKKKKTKLSSAEARKKKKERMLRRKNGEEVFSDED